jgi:hypothetical protein
MERSLLEGCLLVRFCHLYDRDDEDMRNFIALVKGKERYILFYDNVSDALQTLSRWAVDPELSFTWYDAAVMSKRLRNETPIAISKRQ